MLAEAWYLMLPIVFYAMATISNSPSSKLTWGIAAGALAIISGAVLAGSDKVIGILYFILGMAISALNALEAYAT